MPEPGGKEWGVEVPPTVQQESDSCSLVAATAPVFNLRVVGPGRKGADGLYSPHRLRI